MDGLKEIGRGMESTAYMVEDGRVLKLYHKSTADRFENQEHLRRFYGAIDGSGLTFSLPEILENSRQDGKIMTVEKFIDGKPFLSHMKEWTENQAEKSTFHYAAALLALGSVDYAGPKDDPWGYKKLSGNDEIHTWNGFLCFLLNQAFDKYREYFSAYTPGLVERLPKLLNVLKKVRVSSPALIHGDYCPENVLVDENGLVTGVIDFGFSGVMGDYRYDLATAWRFMDMYDQCGYPYKDWFIASVEKMNPLNREDWQAIYAYILWYSVFSAGSYSKKLDDGHAGWCFGNLNNEEYWKRVLK